MSLGDSDLAATKTEKAPSPDGKDGSENTQGGHGEKFAAIGIPGATFIDGRIVAVGGEEPTQVLDKVEMYDIAGGKWTTLAPLPTPRHAAVVATVGNTVYCIGGANRPSHEGGVGTIEALDFS